MNQQNYKEIAKIINQERSKLMSGDFDALRVSRRIAEEIAKYFEKDYFKKPFDKDQFLKDCGVKE